MPLWSSVHQHDRPGLPCIAGSDFGNVDGFNMYHGTTVPGFPQHPHAGFETITYIAQGAVVRSGHACPSASVQPPVAAFPMRDKLHLLQCTHS